MIFYFTATGNSKFIAEKIAAETGEQIIDIAECIKNNEFDFDLSGNEKLGIVLPIYYYGPPLIVVEFLEKLNITAKDDYYRYAILNCGGQTGETKKIITKYFQFDAVFGLKTVDNYVPLFKSESDEKVEVLLDQAELAITEIITQINNQSCGDFNSAKGILPSLITTVAYPLYKHGRKTRKFKVNDQCVSCNLCADICPRKTIELKDGRPVWQTPQCELCLACLHRCPVAAISYGNSIKNGRYLNPRVEL